MNEDKNLLILKLDITYLIKRSNLDPVKIDLSRYNVDYVVDVVKDNDKFYTKPIQYLYNTKSKELTLLNNIENIIKIYFRSIAEERNIKIERLLYE